MVVPCILRTSWPRCWWYCLITRTNWFPSSIGSSTLRWADDTLAYMYKGGGGRWYIAHFLFQYLPVWWSLLGVSSTLLHTCTHLPTHTHPHSWRPLRADVPCSEATEKCSLAPSKSSAFTISSLSWDLILQLMKVLSTPSEGGEGEYWTA